jgi:hypothetical protein
MNLRELKLQERFEDIIGLSHLEDVYRYISSELFSLHPMEPTQTAEEREVISIIKKETRLDFDTSIWIGRRNVDIIFYAIAGIPNTPMRCKGLIIEVDGTIHDRYLKMQRDNSKFSMVHDLSIGLTVIENKDLKNKTFISMIKGLKKCPRLDTRAKNRLKRSIYIKTILCNEKLVDLNDCFDEKSLRLLRSIR